MIRTVVTFSFTPAPIETESFCLGTAARFFADTVARTRFLLNMKQIWATSCMAQWPTKQCIRRGSRFPKGKEHFRGGYLQAYCKICRVKGVKNRTVLRVDSFATVNDRKACDMSKITEFCMENTLNLACQCI